MPSTIPVALSVNMEELDDITKDKVESSGPDKPTIDETNNPTPEDSAPPVERVAIDVPPRPSLTWGLSRHQP